MPRRRMTTVRRRKYGKRRIGSGFWGNIWNGIKSAANWVKDQKLISRGLSLIPHPAGRVGSVITGALGLGRRRRRTVRRRAAPRRRRVGGSWYSSLASALSPTKRIPLIPFTGRGRRGGNVRGWLSKAHAFVKKHKLVSRGLRTFLPSSNLHYAASALGYGRRRKRIVRRRRGGNLTKPKSFLARAHNYIKSNRLVSRGLRHFGQDRLAAAAHVLGYGRRSGCGAGGYNYFSRDQISACKF